MTKQLNSEQRDVIQIMLASELFESFAMLFMQSSGFSLPFISAVIAVLPFISFVISGMGTFAGKKSRRL